MANENVNKVVLGNETLLDLTGDTATEADVVRGKTFHLASGAPGTGSAVIPEPSSTTPLMDGTASVGSEDEYARGDHRHPSDTSKVPTSRKVNGHALTEDINIIFSDLNIEKTVFAGTRDANASSGICDGLYISGLDIVILTFNFVATSAVNTSATLFTIPADYRPDSRKRGTMFFKTSSATGGGACYINANGTINQGGSNSCTGGSGIIIYSL